MTKYIVRIIAGGIAILMAAACTSISTNIPSTRFESSEVPGHLNWRMAAGAATEQVVTFTDDASQRPVTFANTFSATAVPMLKGSLGLSDHFEIGVRYELPSMLAIKGKFQIFGEPAIDARKGNFSLSLAAGAGADYSSNSGTQEGLFGPGGYNWSASAQNTMYDFSLITGVRATDNFLIFASPFVTTYGLTGSINQAASNNGQSPATNYTLYGNGVSYGGSLGMQVYFGRRKNMSIMTDLTGQVLQWSTAGTQGTIGGGVLFEFSI